MLYLNYITGFLNASAIKNNLNTTTWLLIGGLAFQMATLLLTARIAIFLAILALLTTIVPTILITTNQIPNPKLAEVQQGKTSPLFPNPDGSKGAPSGRGFAMLIIGIKTSHPLGIFAPGVKKTGDYFMNLVKELEAQPTAHGYLGGSYITGDNGHLSLICYFDTMDALHAYAQSPLHRECWNWWNREFKAMPHIGVYHEAFDIPARGWEAVYLQTPKMLLGDAKAILDDGSRVDILADARKGAFRSSHGRLGREGGSVPESDPFKNEK